MEIRPNTIPVLDIRLLKGDVIEELLDTSS
jgi:hypothetical protein